MAHLFHLVNNLLTSGNGLVACTLIKIHSTMLKISFWEEIFVGHPEEVKLKCWNMKWKFIAGIFQFFLYVSYEFEVDGSKALK